MKIVQSVPSVCHNKTKSRQINVCQLKNVSRENKDRLAFKNAGRSFISMLQY